MNLERLPARGRDFVNVVVETPRGSRTKYKYDPKAQVFVAHKFLPCGMSFPVNFGFIPSTRGEDGDPLDVALLMEEPSPPGSLIHARILGVIEATQAQDGRSFRNDRLIGVPAEDGNFKHLRTLDDVKSGFFEELEKFFVAYNEVQGRQFIPQGREGPMRAQRLIHAGATVHRQRSTVNKLYPKRTQ